MFQEEWCTGTETFLSLLQLFQQAEVTWDFGAHDGGLYTLGAGMCSELDLRDTKCLEDA